METKNETKTTNNSFDLSNWENRAVLRMIIFESLLQYSNEVSMQKDKVKRDEIAYLKAYDLVWNFSKNFDSLFMGDNYKTKLQNVSRFLQEYFDKINEGKKNVF